MDKETNRYGYRERQEHSGMGISFGQTQQLAGGWMVPRYPESFGYRKVGDSRLRMKFEKDA